MLLPLRLMMKTLLAKYVTDNPHKFLGEMGSQSMCAKAEGFRRRSQS
jgi:hypothetical protein